MFFVCSTLLSGWSAGENTQQCSAIEIWNMLNQKSDSETRNLKPSILLVLSKVLKSALQSASGLISEFWSKSQTQASEFKNYVCIVDGTEYFVGCSMLKEMWRKTGEIFKLYQLLVLLLQPWKLSYEKSAKTAYIFFPKS